VDANFSGSPQQIFPIKLYADRVSGAQNYIFKDPQGRSCFRSQHSVAIKIVNCTESVTGAVEFQARLSFSTQWLILVSRKNKYKQVHFISLFKSDANARALPAIFLLLVRGAARLCEGGSLSSRATQAGSQGDVCN
jgi:hypothetical protein